MGEILNVKDMLSDKWEHVSKPGRWILALDGCDAFIVDDTGPNTILDSLLTKKEVCITFHSDNYVSSKASEKFLAQMADTLWFGKPLGHISFKFLNQIGNVKHLFSLENASNKSWNLISPEKHKIIFSFKSANVDVRNYKICKLKNIIRILKYKFL